MRALLILLGLALALPAFAFAQDVDIQCWAQRLGSGGTITIAQQSERTTAHLYECNQPMPYVAPAGRWVCIDTREGAFYAGNREVGGQTAYANLMHDRLGHLGYHSLPVPPNTAPNTPMAFPPGEPLLIRVAIADIGTWGRFRWAGFLGQPAGTARELACR